VSGTVISIEARPLAEVETVAKLETGEEVVEVSYQRTVRLSPDPNPVMASVNFEPTKPDDWDGVKAG